MNFGIDENGRCSEVCNTYKWNNKVWPLHVLERRLQWLKKWDGGAYTGRQEIQAELKKLSTYIDEIKNKRKRI